MSRLNPFVAVVALATTSLSAQVLTMPRADVEYDRGVDFASLRTFQWKDDQERLSKPARHMAMVTAIERELEKKGLRKTAQGTPDVRVRFYADIEKHLRGTARQSDSPYVGGDPRTSVELEKIRKGGLIIDLYQGDTERRLWRGSASKAFHARSLDEEVIRSAVALVLRGYPPPPGP